MSYRAANPPVPPLVVFCSWTCFAVGALVLLVAVRPLGAQPPTTGSGSSAVGSNTAQSSRSAQSQILEAEILELADGDLDGAMKIYRALSTDEGVEDNIAARSLFALGRCHRKKGELGAARDRFREVVERFPNHPRFADLARRFAAEIDAGRSEIPEFDWLEQVGANAEIQARIFELGMALVNDPLVKDSPALTAKKQLRALGVIVVPILEPMLENSRDAQHRVALAELLVELGRVERFTALIPTPASVELARNFPYKFAQRLMQLPADRQRAAVKVLDSIEVGPSESGRELLAIVRLGLGGRAHLEADLDYVGYNWGAIAETVVADNAAASRIAAYLARHDGTTAISSFEAANHAHIVSGLIYQRPDLVTKAQLAALCNVLPESQSADHRRQRAMSGSRRPERSYFSSSLDSVATALVVAKRIDDVRFLARGDRAPVVLMALCDHPQSTFWQEQGARVDVVAQAKLLRTASAFQSLHRLALEDDRAVAEFESFLMNRKAEGFQTLGGETRPWHGVLSVYGDDEWQSSVNSYWDQVAREVGVSPRGYKGKFENPIITPVFADAMVRVSQRSDDAYSKAIALDALGRAAHLRNRSHANALFECFRNGVTQPGQQDAFLTLLSAVGILSHSSTQAALAAEAFPLLDDYFRRFADREGVYERLCSSWFVDQRRTTSSTNNEASSPGGGVVLPRYLTFAFMTYRLGVLNPERESNATLFPLVRTLLLLPDRDRKDPKPYRDVFDALIAGLIRGDGAAMFDQFWGSAEVTLLKGLNAQRVLVARLNDITQPGSVRIALERLERNGSAFVPETGELPIRFYDAAYRDKSISSIVRAKLLDAIVSDKDRPELAAFLETVDWAGIVRDHEALAAQLGKGATPYLLPHMPLAVESANKAVRSFAYLHFPTDADGFDMAMEKGLRDPDPNAQLAAVRRVLGLETTRALPWLYQLLTSKAQNQRVSAMKRLEHLADARSMPELAKYLEDADFTVREHALTTLQEIERKLGERKKWIERYGKRKKTGSGY